MGVRSSAVLRPLGLVGLLAGCLSLLWVGGAEPAAACTCAELSVAEAMTSADAVFTGDLVHVSESRPQQFTFDVREVFKGGVSATQVVSTPRGGESCGFEMTGPGPYLVFAFDEPQMSAPTGPDHLYSHLCTGSRAITGGVPEEIERLPSVAPLASRAAPETGVEPAADDPSNLGGGSWLLVGTAAAVVLVSAIVWRRRRPDPGRSATWRL